MSETGETSTPTGEPEDPAQPRPTPDDEFDRALHSLTEGAMPSAGPREPSAAEREKAAAQARGKNQKRARKRYMKLEKKDQKEERKQQKAARKAQAAAWGRRSRGRGVAVAAWVGALAVLGGSLWFAGTRLGLASLTGTGGPNDTQVVTNGAVPPVSPVSPASASGPPADPFTGTPANDWADGAAGIVIPKAKPVGGYSAAQVEEAYQTTRKLLIAAALDKQTLLGGAPTAFASLLTRQNRTQFISDLNKVGLDKTGETISTRSEVVSFAPGTTKLIGSVIKVRGTMSAQAKTDASGYRNLDVNVDYLFTYPVEPPRAPEDWMRIVAHFEGDVTFGDWAGAATSFEPWWDAGPSVAGARCGTPDGYAHPDYPNGPADKVQPSGPAINPYSLRPDNGTGCGQTTGT